MQVARVLNPEDAIDRWNKIGPEEEDLCKNTRKGRKIEKGEDQRAFLIVSPWGRKKKVSVSFSWHFPKLVSLDFSWLLQMM
jgi:hypothetical protein